MPHDHHHTTGPVTEHERELEIANRFINYANAGLSDGMNPVTVAAGLRHAAANFSAFAAVHMESAGLDVEGRTEEFRDMLAYYNERHKATVRPMTGLEKLVETVKNE